MATRSTSRPDTDPEAVQVPEPGGSSDLPAAPGPRPSRPSRPRRRRGPWRRLIGVLVVTGLLLVLAGAVFNVVMVGRLDRIENAFTGLSGRPEDSAGRTFLMIGTRPGGSGADVPWLTGQQSVEAVMLVEVAPDGRSAAVETLPQSSGVQPLASTSRPSATVAAVESWSGRRVDHLMAIDWDTFVRLADANDVDAAYDYGSGPSAQHDYLRTVMEGTLHQELRKQPLNLFRALTTTADGTAVDDGWSVIDLDLLLLELRNLRSLDITYSMARPG